MTREHDEPKFTLPAPTARPIPAWGEGFAQPQDSVSDGIRAESPLYLPGMGRAFSPKA